MDDIATPFNLPIVSYESGNHFVSNTPTNQALIDLSVDVRRDPRVYAAYQAANTSWRNITGGSLHMFFNSTRNFQGLNSGQKLTSFTHREFEGQPLSQRHMERNICDFYGV